MSASIGSRLGPYEVLAPIGAGGMGEVYRARDTNLGRDVAIKVLPEAFARDTERMARFQREAKVLASLNHSSIASIYGLETSGRSRALVMELAEGPTLADRIAQGPIPIDEALPIAKQICDALEYAHEKGIIHRDLKPANIKVARDDTVKVLDFGLAKAMENGPSNEDIANSPTLSQMATQAGVLLGTAAYMSPEQAKGKPVDRRTDIWAFGCVLYEMLTGKKAFAGETVPETLAAVLKNEPDWSKLPAATPMRVRVLLQRCLQKGAKQRLRDIGDARISLDEVLSGAPDAELADAPRAAAPLWRRALPWALLGGTAIAFAAFALIVHLRPKGSTQVSRFEIPVSGVGLFGPGALSPDGSKLALVLTDTGGQQRVWVRSLDTLQARPLDGTEGASTLVSWSADSHYTLYSVGAKLIKIDASGGPPQTLCDLPGRELGQASNAHGDILIGSDAGIYRVSEAGGTPVQITAGGLAALPYFLPDGQHFAYLTTAGRDGPGTYVGTVDGSPAQPPVKKLLAEPTAVVYAPSPNGAGGYLLFVRGGGTAPGAVGTLMAQPFDPQRLEFMGDAFPIIEGVPAGGFSASPTGTLAYLYSANGPLRNDPSGARGVIQGRLGWLDREGKVVGTFGDPGEYRTLALSPDGKRIAFEGIGLQNTNSRNIWVYDFARGVTTRFTFGAGWDSTPVWSPDGSHILFGSELQYPGGTFDLYQKPSNLAGDSELVLGSKENKLPSSFSPDGRFLLFFNPIPPVRLWLLPASGAADRKPIELGEKQFNEALGKFAPNGRWIAYTSDESGRSEVYVRPFDEASALGSTGGASAPAGKWMVSNNGGGSALWSRDGKELFYISADGTAMAVDVSTNGIFQAGVPKALFKLPPGVLFWDVSTDGKRFVLTVPQSGTSSPALKLIVALNWQAGFKK